MANYTSNRTGLAHDGDEDRLTILENKLTTMDDLLYVHKTGDLITGVLEFNKITNYLNTVYNGTSYTTLYNHNNGNLSLSAPGAGLYIGYFNTTHVDWLQNKMALNSSGALTTKSHIYANGGYLKTTANGITTTFGSQNSSWVHIYNGHTVPFIFDHTVCSTNGDCGHTSYPWGQVIVKSGGRMWGNGGSLYLGNANNASWVLCQDICSHNGAGDGYWSCRVDGTIHCKSCVQSSSIAIKQNIKDISISDSKKILELRPITFQYKEGWNNDGKDIKDHAGFIAEEVLEIMPEVVAMPSENKTEEENNIMGLSYVDFIPYLVKLAQLQQEEINTLKQKVEQLEQVINSGSLV